MRFLLAVFLPLLPQSAPPPDTEIYLATLARQGGRLVIGAPLNISSNPGYDNQPSFTPDGTAMLFSSVRGGRAPDPANAAASGSDIYRYDVAAAMLTQLTSTPESEYSPTVTPDGAHVSMVRVERDGTQRLWRMGLDGRELELLLANVKPVGYHAWIDRDRLALYVLGQPATLQLGTVSADASSIVATGVGRSIQRAPDGTISFVRREGDAAVVYAFDPPTRQTSRLVTAPAAMTEVDTAWMPDGMLLVAQGSTLYGWRKGDPAFQPLADLAALGLRGVTRLAVSPRGDRIAMVASPR